MKSRKPLKHGTLQVGMVSALLVVSVWYADKDNTSPGKLTATHAQVPQLLGSKGCQACHGSESKGMTESCVVCHEEIAAQMSARTGFHGLLGTNVARDCAHCHSEHHGRKFQMISARSFSLAGVANWKNFDHAGLNFQLTGKHQAIACRKCHSLAEVEVLPAEKKRFLGLDQNCISCHTDKKGKGETFAGGRALKTPFGTYYSPNITADKETGIGDWSDEGFVRALKKGVRPDGSRYFPVFPYTSYTLMRVEDALAVKAYLFSLPPVARRNRDHDVSPPFGWRWPMRFWQLLFFEEGEFVADGDRIADHIR